MGTYMSSAQFGLRNSQGIRKFFADIVASWPFIIKELREMLRTEHVLGGMNLTCRCLSFDDQLQRCRGARLRLRFDGCRERARWCFDIGERCYRVPVARAG